MSHIEYEVYETSTNELLQFSLFHSSLGKTFIRLVSKLKGYKPTFILFFIFSAEDHSGYVTICTLFFPMIKR